jgi:hypothetical protein
VSDSFFQTVGVDCGQGKNFIPNFYSFCSSRGPPGARILLGSIKQCTFSVSWTFERGSRDIINNCRCWNITWLMLNNIILGVALGRFLQDHNAAISDLFASAAQVWFPGSEAFSLPDIVRSGALFRGCTAS